jgi:hypothetical protein
VLDGCCEYRSTHRASVRLSEKFLSLSLSVNIFSLTASLKVTLRFLCTVSKVLAEPQQQSMKVYRGMTVMFHIFLAVVTVCYKFHAHAPLCVEQGNWVDSGVFHAPLCVEQGNWVDNRVFINMMLKYSNSHFWKSNHSRLIHSPSSYWLSSDD